MGTKLIIEAPVLTFHILGGTIAIASGIAALSVSKGARVHRKAGNVFVFAMMANATTAAVLGYLHADHGDVVGGLMSLYLIVTGWMTVQRKAAQTGGFEIGAFLLAATAFAVGIYFHLQAVRAGTAILGGVPGYIFFSIIGVAAALDLNAILRGGLKGKHRLARHLWRMHLGFFIAIGSFFPGQIQIFPEFIREVKPVILLFIPALSIFVLMFYWLWRVLLTRWALRTTATFR